MVASDQEKLVLPGTGQAVGGVREPRQARDLTICMECSAKAVLVGGRAIYPHRPDLYGKRFWLCECGAYVGCHPGTQDPLGCPAGPAARKARNAAHAAFDPIWRSRQMSRSEAYKWLASELGQRASETHISWMDEATALKVAHICSAASPAERSDVARDDQKAVS